MRVLHISVYDNVGGAAKAANRLHLNLSKKIESKMLVLHKTTNQKDIISYDKQLDKVIIKILYLIDRFFQILFKKHEKSIFTIIRLRKPGIIYHVKKISPDLVHIHWIGNGMLSVKDLYRINLPIIWTMHDMFIYTGGCYLSKCINFSYQCKNCPDIKSLFQFHSPYYNFLSKGNFLSKIKAISLIAPSKFYLENSNKSQITRKLNKVNIPNVIDEDVFFPISHIKAKLTFGLNPNTIYIGFGSMNFSTDPNKGFNLLIDSIKHISKNVVFLFFGTEIKINDNSNNFNYVNIGYINNDAKLNLLYNCLDVLIVPSFTENLSCTIMEALSASTPVVAFDVGGNSDLIIHKVNGYLAKPFSSEDLATGINWILEQNLRNLKVNARKLILKNFSKTKIIQMHLDLYYKTINL